MLDEFSEYYADCLDGTYDCVDRIVLNAYFRFGQNPGGFRTWWRSLEGSDNQLDNAHLMRMAGRFSRRVRAYAKAHQIRLIDCRVGERKHELAEQYLPADPNFKGVFLILVSRAMAPVWEVQRSKTGKIGNLSRKYAFVNHYSFHILDPEWGHITIKLSGHPPFGAQIILNGHEYVAHQAQKEGIGFSKAGNCFTQVSDAARLAQIADTLGSADIIGPLSQVCDRWIYSACLCFGLDLAEQAKTRFRYQYSIFQGEYSRNLLFTRGGEMEQIFQGVIDRTRSVLEVPTLKTIFGAKKRPSRCRHVKAPRCEVVVERPAYDLTVFKIHFGKLTVRMYTKGEHVLRIEVVIHNARTLPCGYGLDKFSQIVSHLKGILDRFLNVLRCIDVAGLGDAGLDSWSAPAQIGKRRVAGIDISKPRMRAVIETVTCLAPAPQGFRAAELASGAQAVLGTPYTPRQAAYDLKKLQAKNVVHRIAKSRRYETLPEGLQAITALLVLRQKVIQPVLAGAGKPRPGPRPKHLSPLDAHYRTLQLEMRNLFQTVGITA